MSTKQESIATFYSPKFEQSCHLCQHGLHGIELQTQSNGVIVGEPVVVYQTPDVIVSQTFGQPIPVKRGITQSNQKNVYSILESKKNFNFQDLEIFQPLNCLKPHYCQYQQCLCYLFVFYININKFILQKQAKLREYQLALIIKQKSPPSCQFQITSANFQHETELN